MPITSDTIIIAGDTIVGHDQLVDHLIHFDLSDTLGSWLNAGVNVGIRIVLALVVFYLGRLLIRLILKGVGPMLLHRIPNPGLSHFIKSILRVVLWLVLVIVLVNLLGFATVSFAALLASIGMAVGMALSGQLQNFAGGAILLAARPFRIGDYIESQSVEGTVEAIGLFYTTITTADNVKIYLPNGSLSTSAVKNYSEMPYRRCQWTFRIDLSVPFEAAQGVIERELLVDRRIDASRGFLVAVAETTESSYTITARAWCKNEDYWPLYWEVNSRAGHLFANHGFPRPTASVRYTHSTISME